MPRRALIPFSQLQEKEPRVPAEVKTESIETDKPEKETGKGAETENSVQMTEATPIVKQQPLEPQTTRKPQVGDSLRALNDQLISFLKLWFPS